MAQAASIIGIAIAKSYHDKKGRGDANQYWSLRRPVLVTDINPYYFALRPVLVRRVTSTGYFPRLVRVCGMGLSYSALWYARSECLFPAEKKKSPRGGIVGLVRGGGYSSSMGLKGIVQESASAAVRNFPCASRGYTRWPLASKVCIGCLCSR